MSLDSETSRWAVLALANIPVYLVLGAMFFGDLAGFQDCLRFWFTPDWISLLNGEGLEDRWSEMKLFLFVFLCLLTLYGEHRFFFGDPIEGPPSSRRAEPPHQSERGAPRIHPHEVAPAACREPPSRLQRAEEVSPYLKTGIGWRPRPVKNEGYRLVAWKLPTPPAFWRPHEIPGR